MLREDKNFADWEGLVFGYGYGTGETHTLPALKAFMSAIGRDFSPTAYDFEKLEAACGASTAWLLINALCRPDVDVIEYGTSPRYGWLTRYGIALKDYIDARSADDLVSVCCDTPDDYVPCLPDGCNCGPIGYEEGRVCDNPFWPEATASRLLDEEYGTQVDVIRSLTADFNDCNSERARWKARAERAEAERDTAWNNAIRAAVVRLGVLIDRPGAKADRELVRGIRELLREGVAMRCAECDCENGGADCNWIASGDKEGGAA